MDNSLQTGNNSDQIAVCSDANNNAFLSEPSLL